MKLIKNGFEKADITFITDGECDISAGFAQDFGIEKMLHKFSVTGILLNEDDQNAGTNLIPFCDEVYKASDLDTDEIALTVLNRAG